MKRKKRFGGKVYRFSYRIGHPVCSKPARDGVIASVPITEAPSEKSYRHYRLPKRVKTVSKRNPRYKDIRASYAVRRVIYDRDGSPSISGPLVGKVDRRNNRVFRKVFRKGKRKG